ncbi:UvrD-helicase domain-containing protein [Streptococcus suis]|uniref:UvrD-helicase domain-containing protein n=2 Tax=Streptococcus suis TaxID=1307 RepID=UPI002AA2B93F|nr:UvrD-helicase domain-containing protein [Streptococcus suis]HEM3548852.1 ATP-dependent helicase [Streptococcus suis]HEM3559818.1 ATP-dependent helicase [Streptococcus suis]HEM6212373.1 ATP-dependent helicase [Streptococcus suis]
MHDLLEQIENKLLPMGCHFSEEQRSVIFENNDMDVVAGPGTGKTTVLTARIKILLEQLKGSGQGICVLTHTNVAVDEIKSSLKKLGVEEIKNPHFIGTIQDFFNTFFAKKAFHLVLGDKKMQVLDDDIFCERFDKQFEFRKPNFYRDDWNFPNPGNWEIKWNFDHLNQVAMMVERKSYGRAFNESISYLFKQGIITNKCCLELAKWYIEQRRETLRTIISKRFSYLLLDEAQDTNLLQFELISLLFDTTNVTIQKFGDPYQAIYNIFEGDIDLAWKINRTIEKRISKTSRFSDTIVDVVKNVCIERYDDFHSNSHHTSFSPYFIIYKDGDDLIKKYSLLIDSLEANDESFKESNRSKMVLSVRHEELENTFGKRYQRISVKKVDQSNQITLLSNLIYREVSRLFNNSVEELFKSDDTRLQIFNIFKELKSDNKEDATIYLTELVVKLVSKGATVVDDDLLSTGTNRFEEIIQNCSNVISKDLLETNAKSIGTNICLGTIHSVKGETHKATLLMLDSKFSTGYNSSQTSYSMLQLLETYLCKNYVALPEFKSDMEKHTFNALKLAYVALSRPTHLVCIGIPNNKILGDVSLLTSLEKAGWKRYE